MRVHTKLVFDITEDDIRLVSEDGYEYCGPVAECKRDEQKDLAKKQTQFYDTLMKSYSEQFAGQQAILQSLQKAWTPILEAGPMQEGFNAEQRQIMQTQAMEETGAEYQKAKQAAGEAIAARGGVKSGTDDVLMGQIASAGAADMSQKRLAISQASKERGYQQFVQAANVLGGAAQIYNPTGMAGAATAQGDLAYKSTADAYKPSGVWGAIGGILGGAAGSFLGPIGTQIGSSIGKKIGGG